MDTTCETRRASIEAASHLNWTLLRCRYNNVVEPADWDVSQMSCFRSSLKRREQARFSAQGALPPQVIAGGVEPILRAAEKAVSGSDATRAQSPILSI